MTSRSILLSREKTTLHIIPVFLSDIANLLILKLYVRIIEIMLFVRMILLIGMFFLKIEFSSLWIEISRISLENTPRFRKMYI